MNVDCEGVHLADAPRVELSPDRITVIGYPADELAAVIDAVNGYPLVCLRENIPHPHAMATVPADNLHRFTPAAVAAGSTAPFPPVS